jgi:FlaA1/EpsC-like NDP-sugar epimerase
VITIATASRGEIRRIVKICEQAGTKARIIPRLYEILEGRVSVSAIRDVGIEDLLGREPVQLDETGLRSYIGGRTVMVTGAGGSIGSELARQVLRFGPARLLLVERSEPALFSIEQELLARKDEIEIVPLIGDVVDGPRMEGIMKGYRPDLVVHAAAHKHVPLMETNVCEAVKNNSIGTRRLAEIAGAAGVESFVLISTDKAVNPSSVMGASKRVAELAVQGLGGRFRTRFVAVRFGNVLNSAGSVVPVFREQIRRGGPVTVTDPEMKRYFMTIPEAAQLVLQAGALGRGGEIFILDMGEPVMVLALAVEMIRLSGLKPYEDIDIVFTGLRPGEKLYEEMATTGEHVEKTRHSKIFIGKVQPPESRAVESGLCRLEETAVAGDEAGTLEVLRELLPEATLNGGNGVSRRTGAQVAKIVVESESAK